jgi:hypothetical protein
VIAVPAATSPEPRGTANLSGVKIAPSASSASQPSKRISSVTPYTRRVVPCRSPLSSGIPGARRTPAEMSAGRVGETLSHSARVVTSAIPSRGA